MTPFSIWKVEKKLRHGIHKCICFVRNGLQYINTTLGEARSIIKEKSDIHYKSLYHHRIKLGSACFSIAAVVRMAFLVVC